MKKLFLLLCATLALGSVEAQTATLIRDINLKGDAFGINADNQRFLSNSKYIFFAADNGTDGTEIFRTDGTAAGTIMLKDISPNASSYPKGFFLFKDEVYFSAIAGNVQGLYKTDGTAAGTVLIKQMSLDINRTKPEIIEYKGNLYFGVDGELWKSDGTAAGTSKVAVLSSVPSGSYKEVKDFIIFNNKLYFAAKTGFFEINLMESDGTEAGTKIVKDVFPNDNDEVGYLGVVNGKLYFQANYKTKGNKELYVSDGTAAGTKFVKDLNNKTANYYDGTSPLFFTEINGKTLFYADGLYETDGTAAGTTKIATLRSVLYDQDSPNPFIVNGKLLYTRGGDGGTFYVNLYVSDGTSAGSKMIVDQLFGIEPKYLTSIGGKVYFTGYDTDKGQELWVSDGTEAGSKVLLDLVPGVNPSNVANLYNFNGTLYFIANIDNNGYEMYKLNLNVGTNDLATLKNAISIAPNPIRDFLSIKIKNPETEANISLIDVTGKTVSTQKVQYNATLNLNTENLLSGIYFVEYRTANGIQIEKVVK